MMDLSSTSYEYLAWFSFTLKYNYIYHAHTTIFCIFNLVSNVKFNITFVTSSCTGSVYIQDPNLVITVNADVPPPSMDKYAHT